jgi:hypothetical protein
MESAVLVERSFRDPTEQSQDRKVMRDDKHGFRRMAARNPLHRLPDSPLDVRETLAAGHCQQGRLPAPLADELRVPFADLDKSQAFQVSMIELAEIFVSDNVDPVILPDSIRRLESTVQMAGIDRVDLFLS